MQPCFSLQPDFDPRMQSLIINVGMLQYLSCNTRKQICIMCVRTSQEAIWTISEWHVKLDCINVLHVRVHACAAVGSMYVRRWGLCMCGCGVHVCAAVGSMYVRPWGPCMVPCPCMCGCGVHVCAAVGSMYVRLWGPCMCGGGVYVCAAVGSMYGALSMYVRLWGPCMCGCGVHTILGPQLRGNVASPRNFLVEELTLLA